MTSNVTDKDWEYFKSGIKDMKQKKIIVSIEEYGLVESDVILNSQIAPLF